MKTATETFTPSLATIAPDALSAVAGGCPACDPSAAAGTAAQAQPQQPASGGLGAQLGAQLPGLLTSVLGSFMKK